MHQRPAARTMFLILAILLFLGEAFPSPASAQGDESPKARAEVLAEEARQFWDLNAYPQAIAKFQESLLRWSRSCACPSGSN